MIPETEAIARAYLAGYGSGMLLSTIFFLIIARDLRIVLPMVAAQVIALCLVWWVVMP